MRGVSMRKGKELLGTGDEGKEGMRGEGDVRGGQGRGRELLSQKGGAGRVTSVKHY